MSRWSICLSKAVTWAKPTAPNSWDNGLASGRQRLSESMIGKRRKPPHQRHSRSVQAFRKKLRQQRSNDGGRPESEKRRDSLIDNVKRFIPLPRSPTLSPSAHHHLRVCTCHRPNLIPIESIQCRFCPFVHSRWRTTHEASSAASL